MKYIVTERGPIDRHPPGTDVTRLYSIDTLIRLIQEGYVDVQDKPTPEKRKAKEAVTDGD